MHANKMTDRVFEQPIQQASDFEFNQEVVNVFDDMVSRSVPAYNQIQQLLVELAGSFAVEGSNVYDLGCSTGTTLAMLRGSLPVDVCCVGLDYSVEMLEKCGEKLSNLRLTDAVRLDRADFNDGVRIENASVVAMVLTLMFIRPMNREKLLADIYAGLSHNGCLLLVEKVLGDKPQINRLLIKKYYDYKRRMGYSELEIAQKREALENVLIPYTALENREMLLKVGFREVDVFFRYYNFAAFIAVR